MATLTARDEKELPETVDVSTKEGLELVSNASDHSYKKLSDRASLQDYLETGVPPAVIYKDALLFSVGDDFYGDAIFAVRKGVISRIEAQFDSINAGHYKAMLTTIPTGVIVPSEKRIGKNKKFKLLALQNGDEDHNSLAENLNVDMPTLSFECLARFFAKNPANANIIGIVPLLTSGLLSVVDFTTDEHKPLTKEQKKQLTAHRRSTKNPMPKGPVGFTVVNNQWHRSATVLFRDTRNNGKSILIGQDEGTYFGVELPSNPQSIADAYDALIPEGAKNTSFKRQGEWFAVPVAEKDVPSVTEAVALSGEQIILPVDNPEANRHTIYSEDVRVSKEGIIFAQDVRVEHSAGEHVELEAKGWVKFLRNTALRSFSVAGVD